MKENMRTGNLPANMKKARVIQIIPCKGPPVEGRPSRHAPSGGYPGASVAGRSLTTRSYKPGVQGGVPSGSSVKCGEENTRL